MKKTLLILVLLFQHKFVEAADGAKNEDSGEARPTPLAERCHSHFPAIPPEFSQLIPKERALFNESAKIMVEQGKTPPRWSSLPGQKLRGKSHRIQNMKSDKNLFSDQFDKYSEILSSKPMCFQALKDKQISFAAAEEKAPSNLVKLKKFLLRMSGCEEFRNFWNFAKINHVIHENERIIRSTGLQYACEFEGMYEPSMARFATFLFNFQSLRKKELEELKGKQKSAFRKRLEAKLLKKARGLEEATDLERMREEEYRHWYGVNSSDFTLKEDNIPNIAITVESWRMVMNFADEIQSKKERNAKKKVSWKNGARGVGSLLKGMSVLPFGKPIAKGVEAGVDMIEGNKNTRAETRKSLTQLIERMLQVIEKGCDAGEIEHTFLLLSQLTLHMTPGSFYTSFPKIAFMFLAYRENVNYNGNGFLAHLADLYYKSMSYCDLMGHH